MFSTSCIFGCNLTCAEAAHFHKTLIVAAPRTPSGEGELFLFTKRQQLRIDKLGSVVRVDAQERKREQLLGSLESNNNGRLSSVEERKAFGPPGGNIGQC